MEQHKYLVLDQGNTRCKAQVFMGDEVISSMNYACIDEAFEDFDSSLSRCIFSSTRNVSKETQDQLKALFNQYVFLDGDTDLPIEVEYASKTTLGPDRIANAVGAWNKFPNKHVLVIDIGTCMTFDFLHATRGFLGGSISPGLKLRAKAMNDYTDKLPLVQPNKDVNLIGNNTKQCLESGVVNGIRSEIWGTINAYRSYYPSALVVLTGGDHSYFDYGLKNFIFADSKLTTKGLYQILLHHVQ
ncbi:MAG: type III pantothenate kinase [Flavobacteriales bacterium]